MTLVYKAFAVWDLYIPDCDHCKRADQHVIGFVITESVLPMLISVDFDPNFAVRVPELSRIVNHLKTVRTNLDKDTSKHVGLIKNNPVRRWVTYGEIIEQLDLFIKLSQDYPNAVVRVSFSDENVSD